MVQSIAMTAMLTCVQSIAMTAMLTRDYRECSQYSRSSVGTPELKMSQDSLKQPCLIIANLQNILEIRCEDDQQFSCIT